MLGNIKGWVEQLQDIYKNPPDHVALDMMDEFKRHVGAAIDIAEKEAIAMDRIDRDPLHRSLRGIFLAQALAKVMEPFHKATACCVFEKRGPRGPAEIAVALIDTPDGEPHNREKLYPVPQR